MAMSDLPRDLLEEILSRVPVKSIKAVRSTCKDWNTLSHDQGFTKKLFGKTLATKEGEFLMIMTTIYDVCLMSVNLHDSNVESCIMEKATLISLNDDEDYYRFNKRFIVFNCDGLLLVLCMTNNDLSLVVWNPYCGQTRWIEPRTRNEPMLFLKRYVLGYEKKKTNNSVYNHKILVFSVLWDRKYHEFELYDLNSDSWKVLYPTCDRELLFFGPGVSLKGNSYWLARDLYTEGPIEDLPKFLICFDFTTEKFGPRLRLPFHSNYDDTVTLSSVREEQLAVLFLLNSTLRMEIWVTNKIEPDKVSWNNKLFLTVNLGQYSQFRLSTSSFFIDEKKNVVVVLGWDVNNFHRKLAYIIGKDGYCEEEVDFGEPSTYWYLLMCSYVPSSVQIKQASSKIKTNKVYKLCSNIIAYWQKMITG